MFTYCHTIYLFLLLSECGLGSYMFTLMIIEIIKQLISNLISSSKGIHFLTLFYTSYNSTSEQNFIFDNNFNRGRKLGMITFLHDLIAAIFLINVSGSTSDSNFK